MKHVLPLGRNRLIVMGVVIVVWIIGAWFIAKTRYDSRAREVIHDETRQLEDDEDDIGAVAHRSGNKSWALPEAQE